MDTSRDQKRVKNPIIRSPEARRSVPHLLACALLGAGGLAIAPSFVLCQEAPDARSILEKTLAKRSERFEGVENYTLVQTLNGMQTTLYFERVNVDGIPSFRIVSPAEYQKTKLEKAGLANGLPGQAAGTAGGPGGAAGAPGAPTGLPLDLPLAEGLPVLEGLPLPEGLPLTGALPGGGLPSGLPGVPGAGAAGGKGSLLQKAGGAALGAATGELQQQLMQKGMQSLMGAATSSADEGAEEGELPVLFLQDLAATARLEGTEMVDGAECYVVRSDGIQDPELARRMTGGGELELQSIAMWIDAEEYVPRRSMLTGVMTAQGQTHDVKLEFLSQDYRQVEGMYEPFHLVVRMSGMMDALAAEDPEKAKNISKETREALAQMEKMEEMLAKMPPEQRRMAEAQMGAAREQLKQVSGGSFGDMEMVTEIEEIRVNAGPPTPFGTGEVIVEGDAGVELTHVIARVTPGADASGRAAGWIIQLVGAVEGEVGGLVQVQVLGDLPANSDATGNAGASFRWEDGKQAQFAAGEGEARVTISARDATRIAGEFSFQATGQVRTVGGEAHDGRAVIHGRFEAPAPPAVPGIGPGGL